MNGVKLGATVCTAAALCAGFNDALFSDSERKAVLDFWNAKDRYSVEPAPDAAKKGIWQVRLTPEGSKWLWAYNKARGLGKTPPTETPPPQNPDETLWEQWIDSKVAYDRWVAAGVAAKLNAAVGEIALPATTPIEEEPILLGPIPPSLLALAGDPPVFAEAVVPLGHVVKFPDIEVHYVDNTAMRPRYAYYRYRQGVTYLGKRVREMPAGELESLFDDAKVSPSERKIMSAVSLLEGGFESVNTYDTGYVSVGFIQFACLEAGGGSLGQVLLKYKTNNAELFQKDFRQFGLDATPEGFLVAIDPSTGAELTGPDAAEKIIDDKRLIAVFQRAGEKSREFRIAQIQVAKEQYFPAQEQVSVTVGENTLTGKVEDFVASEAGMAVLMDRKVNTGKLDGLVDVLAYCAERSGAKSLKDLAPYERDIAFLMRYRKDYLSDPTLSQPGPALLVPNDYKEIASRRGQRGGRIPPSE